MAAAAYFVSQGMQRNIAKKRKEVGHQLDQVNDDFSDFSLSSPARKIRRLDAQLPPIMEEEEVEFNPGIEELENPERAIVPFNPINNPLLLQNPCAVSLSSDLISGFEEHFLRCSYQYGGKCEEDYKENQNQCKAVVPWVPSSQQPPPTPSTEVSQGEEGIGVPMEDEEMGTVAMEIEESESSALPTAQGTASNGFGGGFLQWRLQHCMIPQPPQNTSTPITWLQ